MQTTPVLETTAPILPPSIEPKALDVVVMAFEALGYSLSARALLMVALIGAFVLSVMAIQHTDLKAFIVVALYGALVVIPLVILEIRKR